MSLFYHSAKGFVNRPFVDIDSVTKSSPLHSQMFRPVGKTSSFSSIFNDVGSPSVPALNSSSRPTAIISTVISLVVDSVNRRVFLSKLSNMFAIGIKHLLLKKQEVLPMIFNSSSSIMPKILVAGRVASTVDVFPSRVKPSSSHTMSIVGIFNSPMVMYHDFFTKRGHTLIRMCPPLVIS